MQISTDSDEAGSVAEYLAGILRPSTGYELPVNNESASGSGATIALLPLEVSGEGYEMQVDSDGIEVRTNEPAGLFMGVQTLR